MKPLQRSQQWFILGSICTSIEDLYYTCRLLPLRSSVWALHSVARIIQGLFFPKEHLLHMYCMPSYDIEGKGKPRSSWTPLSSEALRKTDSNQISAYLYGAEGTRPLTQLQCSFLLNERVGLAVLCLEIAMAIEEKCVSLPSLKK